MNKKLILTFGVLFTMGLTFLTINRSKQTDESSRDPAALKGPSWIAKGKAITALPDGKNFIDKFNQAPADKKLFLFFEWSKAVPTQLYKELRDTQPFLEGPALELDGFSDGWFSGNSIKRSLIVTRRSDVLDILNHPEITPIYRGKRKNGLPEAPATAHLLPNESGQEAFRAEIERYTQDAITNGQYIGQHHNGSFFGRLEVVNQLGREVAFNVMTERFAVSPSQKAMLVEASRAIQEDFLFPHLATKTVRKQALEGIDDIEVYFRETLSKSQGNAQSMVAKLFNGDLKEMKRLKSYRDPLISAGILSTVLGSIESTQSAVSLALEQILKRHEMLTAAVAAATAKDHKAFAQIVWEALRFNPVHPIVVRYVEKNVKLKSGRVIEGNTLVFASVHSAMLDESQVSDPDHFSASRNPDTYLHFKFDHPGYDVGDRLTLLMVPPILEALIQKPGIRRALGYAGDVSKMGMVPTHTIRSFPEHFAIEYDSEAPAPDSLQIADKNYPVETFLNDFDRNDYRACLSGEHGYLSIPVNLFRHNHSTTNKGLTLCRLKKEFRDCMIWQLGAFIVDPKKDHAKAVKKCVAKHPNSLTDIERRFYMAAFANDALPKNLQKYPRTQIKRPEAKLLNPTARNGGYDGGGWDFEDDLKFFNQYSYRDCHMNPIGVWHMKNNHKFEFYSRMNEPFRLYCFGPTEIHKIGEKVGKSFKEMMTFKSEDGFKMPADAEMVQMHKEVFELCRHGKYDPDEGRVQGALSPLEEYYFRKVMMEEDPGPIEAVRVK